MLIVDGKEDAWRLLHGFSVGAVAVKIGSWRAVQSSISTSGYITMVHLWSKGRNRWQVFLVALELGVSPVSPAVPKALVL